MTEFGKTLRDAREKKGLTIAQIAEQTHLLPQIVEDLENEDFHRISAPIYGRGFVKLYCETVDLEAKPLVDEFMAILNGERAPAIRVKEVALPEEPTTPVEPPPPPPPVYTQPELGESADEVETVGGGEVETVGGGGERTDSVSDDAASRRVYGNTESLNVDAESLRVTLNQSSSVNLTPPPPPSPAPRQYHPDFAQSAAYGPSVNFGRLAILLGGAIVILVGLFFGIRAIYRASMGVPATSEAKPEVNEVKVKGEGEQRTDSASNDAASRRVHVDAASSPRQNKKKTSASDADKPPRQKRTPKTVKPLYID